MRSKKVECKIFYNKLIPDNKLLKLIFKTDLKNARKPQKLYFFAPLIMSSKLKISQNYNLFKI